MEKDQSEIASEYLFQNIFNARIASSKEELAEKLGYPENEFNRIFNMDWIDIDIYYPDFKFKLRKIIPDYNTDWWRKGNRSKEYLTESDKEHTQVIGDGNNVNTPSALDKALEALAKAQEMNAKSQEQIDRLITLLEKQGNK